MKELNQSQFALLGLLSIAPMSGYDLKQLSEWSVGHFWRESYGQIYPSLRKLEELGLVKHSTETKPGRPDRHVYRLTSAGEGELEHWLELPPVNEVPRNELLLKLFFGGLIGPEACIEHLSKHLLKLHEDLVAYEATQKRIEKESGKHPQRRYWLLTLSYGEHITKAQIAWCEKSLRELKRQGTENRE